MSRDIPVFSGGNEIDGLKESLLQCQQQLDRSNAKILAREKRIKELREEIASKDMQLENRKEELTAQVEDNEKMQTKLQGLKAQDGEIEALRSTVEELRTTIQNLQNDRLAARRQEAQQKEAENIRNLEELRGRIQPAMNIVRFVDCLIRDINNPGLLKDIKRSRQIEGEFATHRLSLAFPYTLFRADPSS
jgi:chromosome segregation ATPase